MENWDGLGLQLEYLDQGPALVTKKRGGGPQMVLVNASNTTMNRVPPAPLPLSRCSRVSKWISSLCSLDVL